MQLKHGVSAYAQVGLESQLAGASPHQLITMLFDGAHNAILRAKIFFDNGNIAKRGQMISKAINIVDNGLRAALDHEKGKEIAYDLDRLYEFISFTLLQSNLHNDPDKLMVADRILMDIADTWKSINPQRKG